MYQLRMASQSVCEGQSRFVLYGLSHLPSFPPRPRQAVVRHFLALANAEHLGTAGGAYTLSRRLTILHGYRLSVLHLLLGSAFHAIRLHVDLLNSYS